MILVIGSGIIGTWVALQFAIKGEEVFVIEKTTSFGDGISGRNSGVLHSGIYYDFGSLKSRMCFRGYELSIPFFETNKIPYMLCGKLITIGRSDTQDENKQKLVDLDNLYQNGKNFGIQNIEKISNPKEKWCHVIGTEGLWIPKTGIVDVSHYLKALRFLAEKNGVSFLNHKLFQRVEGENFLVDLSSGMRESIEADLFVNAGGLYSDEVAKQTGLVGYEIRPNKGEYYRLKKNLPYEVLIYPLPQKSSTALGVHYTFHLGGDAYAGPNSNWAKTKEDYNFQTGRSEYFASLSKILDFYSEEDLVEGYVGLRPRLFFQNKPVKDFVINKEGSWIHLLGIESPGLTSSPAIAEEVMRLAGL